jgi:hypothetical protein
MERSLAQLGPGASEKTLGLGLAVSLEKTVNAA